MRKLDLVGKRNERLVVLERLAVSEHGWSWFKCQCDCGNTVKVSHPALYKQKSCGCYKKDNPNNRSHGMSKTSEYKTWLKMRERVFCETDPDYSDYGGAGIGMQADWATDFQKFYDHIGPKPKEARIVRYTVDRIDNSRGYEEGNVRWATNETQARNKSLQRNNQSGVCGVLWDDKRHPNGLDSTLYAKAFWDDLELKQRTKVFSTKKFGLLPAFALAVEHRRKMIQQLNEAGAGYTPEHGL